MAVSFNSSNSHVSFEVGDYQPFPKPEAEDAATEKTPKPKLKHLSVVLLSFGLLCILQSILNISLRLTLNTPTLSDPTLSDPTPYTPTLSDPTPYTPTLSDPTPNTPTLSTPTDKCETKTEEERCPRGWLMFGSSCYYISPERRRLNWDDSRGNCVQNGGDLVIINNRQEQNFLTGFTMAAWVGMTDREKEGTWIWVDGTPVNKDRLLWAPGQPDNSLGGEDCGDLRTMTDFIGLNDVNCSVRIQWICEKNITIA